MGRSSISMLCIVAGTSFLLTSGPVRGQQKEAGLPVALRPVNGKVFLSTNTDIYDATNVNYDSSIKIRGIPKLMGSYIIKTLDFQPEQAMYELYLRLNGKMTPETLGQGFKSIRYRLADTVRLSRKRVRHFILFLIGRNDKGQVEIVGDANNNYDFSDDKVFVFDSTELTHPSHLSDEEGSDCFHYQYTDEGRVLDGQVFLRMSARQGAFRYADPVEQRFYLIVFWQELRKGIFRTKDSSYEFTVLPSTFHFPFYKRPKIYLDGNDTVYYFVQDTVYLKDNKYVVTDVSPLGDHLTLAYAGSDSQLYGVYPGLSAYEIKGADLLSSRLFQLSELKGKYVLLDFWGTWCGPCLASIPDLTKTSKRFQSRLQIVSIAEEYHDNPDSVRAVIRKYGMEWIHLWEKMGGGGGEIANRYKIQFYPTQILLDPEGKIIYRSKAGEPSIAAKTLETLIVE